MKASLKQDRYQGCENIFGTLTADIRARLDAVIAHPSATTWEDAFCIVLRDKGFGLTLWQAVIAVDPTFPTSGKVTDQHGKILKPWPRIPDSFTIRRAIRYAQQQGGQS